MKNYIITYIFLSLLGLSSCDFLEEDPKGYIIEENLPQDYDGALALVIAPYENWVSGANLYGRWFPFWETGTDDQTGSAGLNAGSPVNTYLFHQVNPDEQFYYTGVWVPLWKGVADCNNAIDLIQQMDSTALTDIEEKQLLAEARMNRALYYYHLVRMFGDMPKLTKPSNRLSELVEIPRVDVTEIYQDIIIEDLLYAKTNLPLTHAISYAGRYTRTAAYTLLADVYLTMAGWRYTSQGFLVKGDKEYYQEAMAWADSAIHNEEGFGIITANDVVEGVNPFGEPWREPFSKESLVEFGNLSGLGRGQANEGLAVVQGAMSHAKITEFWGQNLQKFAGSAEGAYVPTPDLYHAFEEGDLRKDFSMLTYSKGSDGVERYSIPLFHKMLDPVIYNGDPGFQGADGNTNVILYRMADAMLIYAEASNEVNGPNQLAMDQINLLRDRAGLEALEYGALSQDEFRELIWKERRVELNGEGKRKFDLVRINRLKQLSDNRDIYYNSSDNPNWKGSEAKEDILVTQPSISYPLHEYLWPIPRPELLLNSNWEQNSGY